MKKKSSFFKNFSITFIWIWLGLFAIAPITLTLITSFLVQDPNKIISLKFTLTNYYILLDQAYINILFRSITLASTCTLICIFIGYPFAYIISRNTNKHRSLLLLLVIIPFWTSSLIRTYAIMSILKAKGIINTILITCGIIDQPLQILYSYTAVLIGCVYDLLPFMLLPLYANIEKLNKEYIEAAQDLGANWITIFIKIIIPLTMPGIISGSVLVFLPAMTMFYVPVLLGGAKDLLIGNLVEYQFLNSNNWPLGTAISIGISLLMILLIIIYWYTAANNEDHKKLT